MSLTDTTRCPVTIPPSIPFEDVRFNLVAGSSIRGSSLRVLGDHAHHYARFDECFASCAATADCAAFVHDKRERMCFYKRKGGRVVSDADGVDLHVRASPPPEASPLPRQVLSGFMLHPLGDVPHRIFMVPGFVSDDEAVSLRRFAGRCFERGAANPADPEHVTLGSSKCKAGSSAVLLARIEERLARLTGVVVHEGDDAIAFSNLRAVGRHGPWMNNVHHDKNKQSAREVSALVYLSTVRDEDGGHTIFPALPKRAEEGGAASATTSATAAVDAFRQQVRAEYASGKRALGCRDPVSGKAQPSCEADLAAGGAVTLAEAECERALTRQEHGLAVRPTMGMALLFWSAREDSEADADMWHAGCLPRADGPMGRWLLHKFKSPLRTPVER